MLATKEQLQKWIDAGKKKMRADSTGIKATLHRNSEVLLRDNEIKNMSIDLGHRIVEGFSFKLYQPCYKSAPVGLIHDIGVIIDGEVVSRDGIQLILKGGQRVMLYDAKTIQDIWWNIVEPITVFVHKKGGLKPGKHELEVIIAEQIAEYYEQPLNMIMGDIEATMLVAK
jgi:hypothetical protein